MIRFIIPAILALAGAGIGIGTKLALSTQSTDQIEIGDELPNEGTSDNEFTNDDTYEVETQTESDFTKLSNQFVIPILSAGKVNSLIVISLSLETSPDTTDEVYRIEPKLRDAFLQILFDHANIGGFDKTLTDGNALTPLRKALKEKAKKILGPTLRDVLITEIIRQDV